MRTRLVVVVGMLVAGCRTMGVDQLAKTGARNEVAAIRDARGHLVEAEGTVLEARLPQAMAPARAGKFRDAAHSSSVDLTTDEGTPVTCFLDGTHAPSEFVAGRRTKLSGKFYDIVQDSDGKTRVVLQRCKVVP